MFIVALVTIAKMWEGPKCECKDKWMKKMWYIHTMEQYPARKEEWNAANCDNMRGP